MERSFSHPDLACALKPSTESVPFWKDLSLTLSEFKVPCLSGGHCEKGRNLDIRKKQKQVWERSMELSVKFIGTSLGSFQSLFILTLQMTITKQFISFSRNETEGEKNGGVLLWCSRLRIQCCHCSELRSVLCYGFNPWSGNCHMLQALLKKRKKKKKKRKYFQIDSKKMLKQQERLRLWNSKSIDPCTWSVDLYKFQDSVV